ncbi:MAG: nitroreductase family deazaflavin-dependent oxidoreductase [Chloroflexi bacterium]|nr:nitroreductase family deazaflavin-dependent oxidoreductase [Chloroflexota bacterium]
MYRLVGGMVLLLTTTGRRSGKPHTVGLQYEWIDGAYWEGAADGRGLIGTATRNPSQGWRYRWVSIAPVPLLKRWKNLAAWRNSWRIA